MSSIDDEQAILAPIQGLAPKGGRRARGGLGGAEAENFLGEKAFSGLGVDTRSATSGPKSTFSPKEMEEDSVLNILGSPGLDEDSIGKSL